MGVQGLWQLVSPVARPVRLETLRDRKLAIDASIWIHQFMRTMRSEDGSVLRNGHTLGFFRRICKLLFYNIKPVFVFDGGAPTLKRSTIRERRKRRQGLKENIKRTAEKILKAQLKTQLLREEEKRRMALEADTLHNDDDENYVYLEQLDNTAALDTLRQQNAIKQDQYALPPLTHSQDRVPRRRMDPRLATEQELQDFIDEFKPSEIDMDSSVFQALPTEIQYEIIQDVKLKSRQTSWARLDNMVRQSKTPLDFSKQQILQLKHRNEMTQRVMQMNDMASKSGDTTTPTRIASERGKQYLLVKNENLQDGLGWKLPGVATTVLSETTDTQHDKEDSDLVDVELHETNADVADDPVARAVASNPKLAALMGDFGNENDDELLQQDDTGDMEQTDMENYQVSDDDDAPLFVNYNEYQQNEDEWDNRGIEAYGNDENTARNEVLSKMYDGYQLDSYSTSSQQYSYDSDVPSIPQESASELELDTDDFYQHWLSRVPDAFVYMYSFNNEYISILQNAISDSTSLTDIEDQLKLVNKVFGKSNDTDSISRDAHLFHQGFLQNTLAWKRRRAEENSRLEMYKHALETKGSPLILDSDDDDIDIQLAESALLPDDSQKSDPAFLSGTIDSHFLASTLLPLSSRKTNDKVEGDDNAKQHTDTELSSTTVSSSSTQRKGMDGIAANQQDDPVTMAGNKRDDGMEDIVGDQQGNTVTMSDNKKDDRMNDIAADQQGVTEEPTMSGNKRDGMDDIVVDQQNDIEEPPTTMYSSGNESDGMDDNDGTNQQDVTEEPTTIMYSSGNESDEKDAIAANQQGAEDIGYNSDEELTGTAAEENAEFARFVSDIASRDIDAVQQELAADVDMLNKTQVKQMGNADTITDQMIQDIQELLQLFGVPYVVSPMEAEAQCAYLLDNDLVDGVVTDDSDVFLFGGSRVYKNMFSQQKYVECYLLQDIAREMHLDRNKLVQLAYFLGSDYTPGLAGIGYVSAMEILAAFEDDSSLEAPLLGFKQWYEGGIDHNEFEKKFRRKHKHLDIPPDFPNPLIKEAYFGPLVDTSLERFTWSPPQLDSLRLYLMKSFTWSEKKADEILIPVIREMNQRQGSQTTISSFFDPTAGFRPASTGKIRKHKSARVQKVVKKLRNKKAVDPSSSSESDDQAPVVKKPRRKPVNP